MRSGIVRIIRPRRRRRGQRLVDNILPFPHRPVREFDRLDRIVVAGIGAAAREPLFHRQRLARRFDQDDQIHIAAAVRTHRKLEIARDYTLAEADHVAPAGGGLVIINHVMAVAEVEHVNIVSGAAFQTVIPRAAMEYVVLDGSFESLIRRCAVDGIQEQSLDEFFQFALLGRAPSSVLTLRGAHQGLPGQNLLHHGA